MYNQLSDIELMTLLKQRDELAFTEIYRRYWHILYLHSRKVLGDADEAKDLVQDLFITFWTKAAGLDVKTNLKGYLYTTARNRILNQIRKQKTNHDFIDIIAGLMDEADHSTLEAIDERELIAAINEEIALLPPKMKEVFELSRTAFLSNKEIAEKLGITEDAVKQRITRSIRILKLKLGDYTGVSMVLITLMHR